MFNFRKIASVLSSAVMVSSTVALAAAASYPAPFVKGGAADVAVVYGSAPGAQLDLPAVVDVTTDLQYHLAKQTAKTSGGTTSSGASATGGDSINLATSSQKLFMNSSINAARTTLSNNELPVLLADGTSTDAAGTAYKYTQKIIPGNRQVLFSKSGESIDPIALVDIGSSAQTPLYNYTLTFVKALNVSDATSVIGTAKLKILGTEYIVGASSTGTDLYLYGSGSPIVVDEGETKSVVVNGVNHTIFLKGTTSATAATLTVDGTQKSVNKGSSYKFPGEFEVYIKDLFHATKTGTLSNADLLLGAQTLHIVNNSAVRVGADDTTIQGTTGLMTVSANTANVVSTVTIAQAAKDATGDYLTANKSFDDRVFAGAVRLQLAGFNPSISSTSRETIVVDTDNSVATKIKVETALAGTKGATTHYYGRDVDGTSDGTLSGVRNADSSNYTLHVQEGSNLTLYDKILVNPGDKGRILQLTALGGGSSATDKTTFQDVITGESFDFTTGTTNTGSRNIDGQTYYVAVLNVSGTGKEANITWGAGAAGGSWGTQRTLFPRIKTKNGGWFTVLVSTNVSNITYNLPGADSLTTYESGVAVVSGVGAGGVGIGQTTQNTTQGKVSYIINWSANSSNPPGNPLNNVSGILSSITFNGGTTNCSFNVTAGPAILFQEEKTVTGSGSTNGEVICMPLTREGTTTVMAAIDTPTFSDDTTLSTRSLASKNAKSQTVTTFGTLLERDTDNNNFVTLWYPDEQMYADLLFTAPAAVVSSSDTGSGGGTVNSLGSVSVSDTESASVASKNLIVIGGSCVNKIAAELLGGDLCGDAFEEKTTVGAGSFLVQTFARTGDKVATLVAGYNAGDTANAVTKLKSEPDKFEIAVGKKFVGNLQNVAMVEVSSTNTTA